MFKTKNSTPISSKRQIQQPLQSYIIQKIARIDGHQTQKKYKKCQLLGKGGFANCYVTENVQTKKKAATKIIEKQLLSSQKTKLRLLNQIRLHKTLHHQNIVQFQHYFEDKDNVFIFLELCQNQSMNQLIKIRQFFSTPQIQSYIYGIIIGLKYLHQNCIIHRDLKLGNIFLDKKFNIKIGDFGLATKLQFKKQCKRTVCGTPNYIAPQILEGKGYHFQVDIWSIGVILYTLYFNIPPFQTEEATTTYQKIKKCQYTIPKNFLVPPQAVDLIKRILVKNPADRPTLNDILMSDFMKIGSKIYKQLPSICSKRMPSKKDFSNMPFYSQQQVIQKVKQQKSFCQSKDQLKSLGNQQIQIDYITNFQSLGDGRYYYLLNDNITSIYTKDEVVFKDEYGTIKCFNPNDKNQKLKNCEQNPLKYLLNCKDKQHLLQKQSSNKIKEKDFLFQATLYPTKTPLHVKKVSEHTKHNFYMVRLSNQTIQLVFEDFIDYLVTGKGQQIYQIKNGNISQVFNLEKHYILNAQQSNKIDQVKLPFIKAILSQIKNMKDNLIKKKQQQKGLQKQNEKYATFQKKKNDDNVAKEKEPFQQIQNQKKLC